MVVFGSYRMAHFGNLILKMDTVFENNFTGVKFIPSNAGSGVNLKGTAPGGNGWDDGTDLGTRSLQGSTFRPRNHHPVHQVVPDVQTQLP